MSFWSFVSWQKALRTTKLVSLVEDMAKFESDHELLEYCFLASGS